MSFTRSSHSETLQLRRALEDEVYGPIVGSVSDPEREQHDFVLLVRDVDLDIDRKCVINTKLLQREEANWLSICNEGRWVCASIQPTPGGVYIVDGLRVAPKKRQKTSPDEMRLIFNHRRAG